MYLIERRGVYLNLNYSIHFYGPYSAALDYVAHTLLDDNGDMEQVVQEVKKIKGDKFDLPRLRQEYEKLRAAGFVS